MAGHLNIDDIRRVLTDRKRSGAPTKMSKKELEKAKRWCHGHVFTPVELQAYMVKISGVKLSMSRVRYYARLWKCSAKKTSPIHINRYSTDKVEEWRKNTIHTVAKYAKRGYAIATEDESNFKDAILSTRFWAKQGRRIFMLWSGGHQRFSMFCTMTADGRYFFNHAKSADTTSFLAHIGTVYEQVGKMVLFLDRKSWHTSKEAMEFFKKRDIIMIYCRTSIS